MIIPPNNTSIPLSIVFWFLAVVAILFVLLAAQQARRNALQPPFEATVAARTVNVLIRDVSYKTPQRTVPKLFCDYQLKLSRSDGKPAVTQTEREMLTKEELVSLEFLDRYAPNTRLTVIQNRDESGSLDLAPANRWYKVVGVLFGAWMFGTFAWMARPFATGADDPGQGIILKIVSLASMLMPVVVFVALLDRQKKSAKESPPRVPVEGFAKRLASNEFVADLKSVGVNVADGVVSWLGESVTFGEYNYGRKTWRTTSLYCQPPEGASCPGRLNPDNPRDVKWEGEP